MNKLMITLALVLLVATQVSAVSADGDQKTEVKTTTKQVCTTTYGGATECRDEIVKEEIKREEVVKREEVIKVETGIVETMLVVSSLFAGGLGLMAVANKQLKV